MTDQAGAQDKSRSKFDELFDSLPPERRDKIHAMAAEMNRARKEAKEAGDRWFRQMKDSIDQLDGPAAEAMKEFVQLAESHQGAKLILLLNEAGTAAEINNSDGRLEVSQTYLLKAYTDPI